MRRFLSALALLAALAAVTPALAVEQAESNWHQWRGPNASMVAVGDRLYVTGRDGTTVVLKHGDDVEVLATNTVGEAVDASPAIVGDVMYIRGAEHLFCVGEK